MTKRQPKGTPGGGQFSPDPHSAGTVTLGTTQTPPSRVAELVLHLNASVMDTEIENLSYVGGDTVKIGDLSDPYFADNNCYTATEAVNVVAAAQGWTEGEDLGVAEVVLDATGNSHCATCVTADGQDWVVDYTLRQYERGADFPTVCTRAEWGHRLGEDNPTRFDPRSS